MNRLPEILNVELVDAETRILHHTSTIIFLDTFLKILIFEKNTPIEGYPFDYENCLKKNIASSVYSTIYSLAFSCSSPKREGGAYLKGEDPKNVSLRLHVTSLLCGNVNIFMAFHGINQNKGGIQRNQPWLSERYPNLFNAMNKDKVSPNHCLVIAEEISLIFKDFINKKISWEK